MVTRQLKDLKTQIPRLDMELKVQGEQGKNGFVTDAVFMCILSWTYAAQLMRIVRASK